MAESNNLFLKKISDITDFKFFIPSFQRGYRWDIMQVEDLLNDIKEYIDIENKESFLCLQPVVVYEKKNKDDKQNENQNENEKDKTFVVIDGQQRLTAIAIIKYYLSEHKEQLKQFDYKIEYEKYLKKDEDKTLSVILSKITDLEKEKDFNELLSTDKLDNKKIITLTNKFATEKCSLDKYHIILSYLVIAYYFNKNNEYIDKFIKLFSSTIDNYSIQFIWYNVTDEITNKVQKDGKEETKINETKAINIFTRLNIGKIPLTDAELIKALFLKKDNFKESEIDKQLHIAYKWDEIEKTLNNDTFWYFICNKKNENEIEIEKRNRIELILELAIGINNGKNHELFKEYENKFKQINNENKDNKDNIHNLDKLWQEIEECFMTLKEWYNDNELYHYIGFLTCSKTCIKDIYKNKDNDNKQPINNKKHIDNIKQMINNVLKIGSQQDTADFINQFNYSNNIISTILLFSNIYTTIKMNMKKNSKEDTNNNLLNRFPFDLYVKESWDIEHIAPQTDNPLNIKKERIIWFIESYKYLKLNFSDDDLRNFLKNINIDNKKIKILYESLQNNELSSLISLYDNKQYSAINNIIFEDENWNLIYAYIFEFVEKNYKEYLLTDEEKDKLGNLVLLPRDINRSYKNALFGVKRKHIIDDEQNNRFIPIDTKHVFLKYYSNNTIDLWVKDDADEYKKIISSNIEHFLNLKKQKEGNTNEY